MKKQNKSVKLLQRRKSDSHLKILSKSKSQKRENIISTNHQTHIIHNETDGLHIKNNNYVAKVVEKIPEPKNKEICYRQKQLRIQKNLLQNHCINIFLKNSNKSKVIYWNNMASYASTTINNSNQNSNHHIHLLSSKYLVLSADFVIDQDNFWNPSYISISVIKMWKHLHKNYFVIWVIRREKVFKEIKEFVKMNCLPLHAIFYMKNKRRYVNNYLPLQFKIQQEMKSEGNKISITILEILKINMKDICSYQSFSGKVPILLKSSNIKVCYLRTQESQPGLEIIPVIIKELYKNASNHIFNLRAIYHYVSQYYDIIYEPQAAKKVQNISENLLKSYQQFRQGKSVKQKECGSEQDVEGREQRVQRFKKQLIGYVVKMKGRQYQFEGVSSIHYFIGDIIKRNYSKLLYTHKTKQFRHIPRQQNLDHEWMSQINTNFYQFIQ